MVGLYHQGAGNTRLTQPSLLLTTIAFVQSVSMQNLPREIFTVFPTPVLHPAECLRALISVPREECSVGEGGLSGKGAANVAHWRWGKICVRNRFGM